MLQRKVSARLRIQVIGNEYDVRPVIGVIVGELINAEPTEHGLLVSRAGQSDRYLLQPQASSF